MHVIVCLDDRNGMLFNSRRLSSDIAVCERVYASHRGRLMMNSYSAGLFAGMDVFVDNQFLSGASADDTCFVEDLSFMEYLQNIRSITVYRWNRRYPSDVKFPGQLLNDWKQSQCTDFKGHSHDTITEERYVR